MNDDLKGRTKSVTVLCYAVIPVCRSLILKIFNYQHLNESLVNILSQFSDL